MKDCLRDVFDSKRVKVDFLHFLRRAKDGKRVHIRCLFKKKSGSFKYETRLSSQPSKEESNHCKTVELLTEAS